MNKKINRRQFFKRGLAATAVVGSTYLLGSNIKLHAESKSDLDNIKLNKDSTLPDLVAVRGGEPDIMFDHAIKAYGGMGRYVKKGQTVVIKPNIVFNKAPEYGTNTNPKLIRSIIEHCKLAGAKKIYVFDHSAHDWGDSYKTSGIQTISQLTGGQMVPANSEKYYVEVNVPGALTLKNVKVHELLLQADVFINVPILKQHKSARVTSAVKNLMGAVWDRRYYHQKGLHECIAEFLLYKKPHLNIVDAYNVMVKNGPMGKSKADLVKMKYQIISTDIVAADSAAALVFGKKPEEILYLNIAKKLNLGTMDLTKLDIKRIRL